MSAQTPSNLPLLLTTTDVRTPKVEQITQNSTVHIAWWIEGSQDQFRISGTASVVPAVSHPLYKKFDPMQGLALVELTKEGIDWQEKRREVFNGMSSHMKASWCRPPPGSVMKGGYEEAKKWPTSIPKLGEAENEGDRKNQEIALGNFALVLVEPYFVDWVQLGVVPNQRTTFTRVGKGEWVEEIVVP
jgi:pyridoxamine 5'-phosphate oxidase